MTILRAMRGPGPRCFDADAVWIGKISWIGDSTGPTSAGKSLKIEAKIPLAHTQSLISWSRWFQTRLGWGNRQPHENLDTHHRYAGENMPRTPIRGENPRTIATRRNVVRDPAN